METLQETYKDLRTFLMCNQSQINPTSRTTDLNNTTIEKRGDKVAVKLHQTDVLTLYPDGRIQLNSGGWRTPTTKDRMNYFLPRHLFVSQDQNVWYVHNRDAQQRVVFEEGMIINPDGSFQNAGNEQEADEQQQLAKDIKAYAKGFTEKFINGDIPPPSGGDCWYCCMKGEDGQTMGDWHEPAVTHLRSHLDEDYHVPSLLKNAYDEYHEQMPLILGNLFHQIWIKQETPEEDDWLVRTGKNYVQAMIENYFRTRFDLPKTRTHR